MIAARLTVMIASLMIAALSDIHAESAGIEGRWQVVSAADSGRATPREEIGEIIWTITTSEISYSVEGKRRGWTYEADASRHPKWIDLTTGGRTRLGIYELRGDELKICYPEGRPGERANAFESKADSVNDVLIVLRRISSDKGAGTGSNRRWVTPRHSVFEGSALNRRAEIDPPKGAKRVMR